MVTFVWCLLRPQSAQQRLERVRKPVCTIHSHYPGYLVVGPEKKRWRKRKKVGEVGKKKRKQRETKRKKVREAGDKYLSCE